LPGNIPQISQTHTHDECNDRKQRLGNHLRQWLFTK